jgi:hypothetical protein
MSKKFDAAISVPMTREMKRAIERMATEQDRKPGNMARVLIERAMEAGLDSPGKRSRVGGVIPMG